MKDKKNLFGNRYVSVCNDTLILDGFSPLQLAEDQPSVATPLFLYLSRKIEANIQQIKTCFAEVFPDAHGFYSTKSNYIQKIIEISRDIGFGAEIIGEVEFNLLKTLDYPMKKVLAGGPYLPDALLNAFIQSGVGYLVIYDIEDIFRIDQMAADLGHNTHVNVIARFRSPKYTGRHGIAYTPENIIKMVGAFKEVSSVHYAGILSHFGTRMKTLTHYEKNITFLIAIAHALKTEGNLDTRILNIGGGFPNADEMKPKELVPILRSLKTQLDDAGLGDCTIFYEPGRFIVGDVGFCLTRVYKVDSETSTVFLDVGNNFIPKFMKTALRFYNLSKISKTPNYPVDFMGPVPSDQDILAKNYNFTKSVAKGDYVLIANIGAYGHTWSTRFPFEFPQIGFISEGRIEFISDPHFN